MATRDPPQLMTLLVDAAGSIGATVGDAATQLTGDKFNSEVLSEAISGKSIDRSDSDLPMVIASVEFDGIPVLVGALTGPAVDKSVEAQLRKYKNQATLARSWLGSNAPNLQLFLIGPENGFGDGKWREIAARIEADERICRKLVWLFNATPALSDAVHFLGRTFVARPWPTEQRSEQLDGMANFALPAGWEEAIEDPNLDFDGLVDRLITREGAGA